MALIRDSRAALLVLGALALAGCGEGAPPVPPGVQVHAGRDFANLFYWNPATWGFTRQTTTPGATTQDLWLLSDGEAQPSLALSGLDWSPPRPGLMLILGNTLMTGADGERIYDRESRTAVNLYQVGNDSPQPYVAGTLTFAAVRRDGKSLLAYRAEESRLEWGPAATVASLEPWQVDGADFLGEDVVILGAATSDPSAAITDDVFRLSEATGTIEKVAGLPSFDLHSTGDNRRDLPTCGRYTTYPCPRFRVVGCSESDPPCAESGRPPCWILYQRTEATPFPPEPRRPYAFDLATGQELALPGSDPDSFVVSPDRHRVAWMARDLGQLSGPGASGENPVHVHDFCTGADTMCTMVRPKRLSWRRDGGALTATVNDRQLGLMNLDAGSCEVFAEGSILSDVYFSFYSPAGDRLAGVSLDRTVDPIRDMLWVSDADGHQPRVLAEGPFESVAFSPDGGRIFVSRVIGTQSSLGWISTVADPPVERVIASAYGGAVARGSHRALVIDRWSGQDASGSLALFDLDRGTRQELARAVTDASVDASVDGTARVTYAVRGRFASGQDGLWQTTLSPLSPP